MGNDFPFVELPISRVDPGPIGRTAARKVFHSVDRVGLPARMLGSRFDDKLMGDLAAAALGLWLVDCGGLSVISYDDVRDDGCQRRDPGWDLAVGTGPIDVGTWSAPWRPAHHLWTISVKSSRVPRHDQSVQVAVGKRDFKIMKYSTCVREDLHSDIETQVYLPNDSQPNPVDISRDEIEAAQLGGPPDERLIDRLGGLDRFRPCLLVAIVSAQRLAARISDSFVMPGLRKSFWKAPLDQFGSPPEVLAKAVRRPVEGWAVGARSGGWRPEPIDPNRPWGTNRLSRPGPGLVRSSMGPQ